MSSGFDQTPTTKVISCFVLLSGVFLGTNERIGFNLNSLFNGNIIEILLSQIVFRNMAQTFVGLILLYTCRQFERQLGMKKFGRFALLTFISSLSFQFALCIISQSAQLNTKLSSGPYFLIFSQLPFFYTYVPILHASKYSLFGFIFSEKSWTYLLALQLFFNEGVCSIVPSVIGLIIGYIYMKDIFGTQKFRLSRRMENCFIFVGGFISSLLPTGTPPNPVPIPGFGIAPGGEVVPGGNQLHGVGNIGGGFGGNVRQRFVPSEDDITTLIVSY
jgi:hypothetical protein